GGQGAGLPHERKQKLEAVIAYIRKRFGLRAILTAEMMRKARRIGLFTYPIGRLLDVPVTVTTNRDGTPTYFSKRGKTRRVVSVQNRWCETEWTWEGLTEK